MNRESTIVENDMMNSARSDPPHPFHSRPLARGLFSAASRRDQPDRRAPNMFRHERATTVVNHPARFSISPVFDRLSRSYDSCTASSASVTTQAYATARKRALFSFELFGQPVLLHPSRPSSKFHSSPSRQG
jgi:hypothetical protein